MPKFQNTIKNLPHKPGVYRFYGLSDEVLYIGKAKNLKNRVSTYFQESRPRNERLTLMISQIERVDYTVTATEKEALILEANLIHSLQPKYNVLLKDDRSYVFVRITSDPIPGIFLTRKKYDPKSTYFGPYTQRSGIYDILRTLRMIFPYCQERFPKNKPCQYVSIKQCDGICVQKENKQDYLEKIENIKKVLKGETKIVENFLKQKMQDSVQVANFELAALWRDRLNKLNSITENQKIILPHPQNVNLLNLILEKQDDGMLIASLFLQNIREGKVINISNFIMTGSDEEDKEEAVMSCFTKFFKSYNDLNADTAPFLIQSFYHNNQES